MQRKKGAKSFWFSFIVRFYDPMFLKLFCGYSCFDLLELPEASPSGWN
jgi:hypothetical protein